MRQKGSVATGFGATRRVSYVRLIPMSVKATALSVLGLCASDGTLIGSVRNPAG